MSLATKCPNCRTTFKVAGDQLKLHAGLVRCGICQHVFNGSEHLVDPGHAIPAQAEIPVKEPTIFEQEEVPTLAIADCNAEEEVIVLNSDDPEEDFEDTAEEVTSEHAPEVVKKEEAENKVEEKKEENNEDIQQLSFIRQARSKNRLRWILLPGVVVLLIMLVGQTAYLFRNLIAATYPASKPALLFFCQYARCDIQLPAQRNALSYEADELHTLPREKTFEFSLLMHNRSDLTQAWPHIELSLQNTQKQTVLRRVFTPVDYLPNEQEVTNGFPAHEEFAVKVYFELDRVKASDYSVAVFYP